MLRVKNISKTVVKRNLVGYSFILPALIGLFGLTTGDRKITAAVSKRHTAEYTIGKNPEQKLYVKRTIRYTAIESR